MEAVCRIPCCAALHRFYFVDVIIGMGVPYLARVFKNGTYKSVVCPCFNISVADFNVTSYKTKRPITLFDDFMCGDQFRLFEISTPR